MLNEGNRVTFRPKIYTRLEELPAYVNHWLEDYYEF